MPTTDQARPTTGREYLRVSADSSGRQRSIEEQHEDNERAASSREVALGRPYREQVQSASRYSTKRRDAFQGLLADLSAGRFGADELWLWESSRGSRKVSEWCALIEGCEAAGVVIYVTSHGRVYDPTNYRDRRSMLEDAVDSEYESGKISQRVGRAMAANAALGKPHGRIPYGYRRTYHPVTRQLVAQEVYEPEAAIVRELFHRLRAGHSLRAIAKDLAERGVRNDKGRTFSASHLGGMARTPVYAGLRVYDPQARKTGIRQPRVGSPTATVVAGEWEAIVPAEEFHAVQAILNDPARKTTRPGRGVHLLSMIARCAECGGPLCVTYRKSPHPEYVCRDKGCIRIRRDDLDELVTAAMLDYLASPEVFQDWQSQRSDDAPLAEVRGQAAAVQAELDALHDAVASGAVSVAALARIEPGLLARLADLRRREVELATPSRLRGIISPGVDVARRWKDLPMAARREVARSLLAEDMLGVLKVRRRPRDSNAYIPAHERVGWVRAESADSA